jgi:hypothetical protein
MTEQRTPSSGQAGFDSLGPEVWVHATFAPRWFADAKREASIDGFDARRREILFAVCFVESYLVEWVRDAVLRPRFRQLAVYFPPRRWIGIAQRWKTVTKQLFDDKLIPAYPNYGHSEAWQNFANLVEYREGLVHGRTGRPQNDRTPVEARPKPTVDELIRLAPGDPTRVVIRLIRELHSTVGTAAPTWLTDP